MGLRSISASRYCVTGHPNTEIKPEISNTPGFLSNKHKITQVEVMQPGFNQQLSVFTRHIHTTCSALVTIWYFDHLVHPHIQIQNHKDSCMTTCEASTNACIWSSTRDTPYGWPNYIFIKTDQVGKSKVHSDCPTTRYAFTEVQWTRLKYIKKNDELIMCINTDYVK